MLAWSPDGSQLAQGSEYGLVIYLADLQKTILPGEPLTSIAGLAWSPDGALLASAEAAQRVRIWDTATWQPAATLNDFSAQLLALAWSNDGSRLASSSADETIQIWDANTYTKTLTIHQYVDDLSWNPNGDRLAGLNGPSLYVWDTATGNLITYVETYQGEYGVHWLADGQAILVTGPFVYDATTGEPRPDLHASGGCAAGSEVYDALSPDGGRIAGIGVQVDGMLGCILPFGEPTSPIIEFQTDAFSADTLAWSPDGENVASSSDRGITLWNPETGEPLASKDNPLVDAVENLPAAQPIVIERVCSTDPEHWIWRLRNPNPFDVDIHWKYQNGSGPYFWNWIIVPAARNDQMGVWVAKTPIQSGEDVFEFSSGLFSGWEAVAHPAMMECVP